jgi:UPF0755 protein
MLEDYKQKWQNMLVRMKLYFYKYNIRPKKTVIAFGVVFFVAILYLFLHTPPSDFPVGKVFRVAPGESLEAITSNLYDMKVIRSPFVFRTTVIILGGEKKLIAGDYLLDKTSSPVDLAYRLTNGKFHLDIVKITIPEGWNVFEIGDYLSKTQIDFDIQRFVSLAKPKEGYLFPDTYFVSKAVKPEDLIEKMYKTFNDKVADIRGLSTTTFELKDVIIMASILEKEARTMESRRIIAGILWKRLSLGMKLQVDATFSYINGKRTFDLTLDDLKIDSPYNTYVYKGLPPGPIGNPGEDSITAAINPIKTNYLYFLTSRDGTKMYYARTFEEHVRNKEKYLW